MGKMRKITLIITAGILLLAVMVSVFCWKRTEMNYTFNMSAPEIVADQLHNPDIGSYHIYQYRLDGRTDLAVEFRNELTKVRNTEGEAFLGDPSQDRLALLEIDLVNYRETTIPDAALRQVSDLLQVLAESDKKGIVRFLYDWEGDVTGKEPDSLGLIEAHMETLAPILLEYEDTVFTTQGLFVGAWGEMHDSAYVNDENLQELADTFRDATQGKIRMAVRTPRQWRVITGVADLTNVPQRWSVLGLYNDGMLGSKTDYGTYAEEKSEKLLVETAWDRTQEIRFQNSLCKSVPNGGETIVENLYNKLRQAIHDMRYMHVTYLNPEYDPQVMTSWQQDTVSSGDLSQWDKVFADMNGRDYIFRHLGYRYVITEARVTRGFLRRKTQIQVDLANVGFAPAYQTLSAKIIMKDSAGNMIWKKTLQGDITDLDGTDGAVITCLSCQWDDDLPEQSGDFYLQLVDEDGNEIELGNKAAEFGYKIGECAVR